MCAADKLLDSCKQIRGGNASFCQRNRTIADVMAEQKLSGMASGEMFV